MFAVDFDPNPYPTIRIWGGDGEREDDTVDDTGQEDDEQDEEDDAGQEDDDKSGDEDDKGPSLEDQLDDEKRKNRQLQKQIDKNKRAKDEAEADKDAAKDRDKYKAKLEARDKFLTENLLTMEINKQKKFDFIDADDVINAIKPDEITIDLEADVPTIDGLDLALKRIAKAKPHFLKAKDDDTEEPPSGGRVGNKRSGSDESEAEVSRLGKKYKVPGFGSQQARPL